MKSNSSSGVTLLGVAQVVLLILKLAHLISCSWWIVFLPLEIELGLIVLGLLYVLVKALLEKIFGW